MIFFIYQFFISLVLLFSPIVIIFRILKGKEDKLRVREKFCFPSRIRNKGKLIWFHGSSVGEIISAIPIIRKYEKNRNIKKILITSSTLSSSKILKNMNFKKIIHQFYPIDHFFFSNKFLNYWQPSTAIFLESEIWPSMFRSIKKNKIPLILLNARITQKTFNRWYKIKNFSSSIFNLIDIAYPQNFETKTFLKKLDVKHIKSIGNLKFIENDQHKYNKIDKNLFSQFKNYVTFIAASTHHKEELFAAKVHKTLKKKKKNLITIIIPRHVNRTNEIIDTLNNLDLNCITHSSNQKLQEDTDVYLVDSYGESSKFYNLTNVCFVGGSIINHGGQNPLEPSRLGNYIINGPNVKNFKEIYAFLNNLKISSSTSNILKMENIILKKLKTKIPDKNIKKIISIGNDVLEKNLFYINKYLI